MMATQTSKSGSPTIHRSKCSALSLKRLRHQCILISNSAIQHVDNNLNNKMSHLSVNVKDVPQTKQRTKSHSHIPPPPPSTADSETAESQSSKRSLSIQRSLSLHEFSEDALPIVMSQDVTDNPCPVSPAPKSPRLNGVLTRRSSFVHGQVFTTNDFITGEVIGVGFFGKAVKVTHRQTGESMVMKELINCDDEGKKTFLQEAAVLRGLSHPRLLKYIGFLYKGKNLHIITEHIPGGTLDKLIHQSTDNLSLMRQLRIALDIASAMEYLHSQQVIHRDLNSPNCLLREDESVVVSDFGLSKLIMDSQNILNSIDRKEVKNISSIVRSPKTGRIRRKKYTVVGNPYWMAPEMINGGFYDERVDVFSFGIILLEVIGKVMADPDCLPRLPTFAVDEAQYTEKFAQNCPKDFLTLAFNCCAYEQDDRPSFEDIHTKLKEIYVSHTASEQKQIRSSDSD